MSVSSQSGEGQSPRQRKYRVGADNKARPASYGTVEQIAERDDMIRALAAAGFNHSAIARVLGVSRPTVVRVVNEGSRR
jgi:transcriptional regulator of acetoin/glycerol metabolism